MLKMYLLVDDQDVVAVAATTKIGGEIVHRLPAEDDFVLDQDLAPDRTKEGGEDEVIRVHGRLLVIVVDDLRVGATGEPRTK